MITLYNIDATTEICVLDEALECLVTEEQNSIFELEMTYSIYSPNFSELKNGRVLKAKASDELREQLFRIYYVSNEINGNIHIKAQHITYDLMDNFVEGVTCTKSTCEQSFQTMLSKCVYEHNFKGYSDIEHTATYNLNRVNPLEAILGTKGSLLDTYGNGAKLKRDNYNIYLNKSRGSNNGVTIAYSKNITGYKREIDETGVITCIYPFAKVQRELGEGDNITTIEETIVLPERFINSKYINNYPHAKILAVDYSEREVKDIESLRTQANKYFQETSKDIPNVNYKVEFVYLHQTAEYEDNNLKELELVGMGDTVTVIDERIGMNVEADVIKTVFNVLTNRYESLELGNFKGSMSDIIGGLETSIDNALDQIDNMYTNFEVLDDKIISEVSRLDGNVKTNTTLINQTADNISLLAKDVEGNTALINQTASNISSEVSKLENGIASNKTLINQTAEGINLEVSNLKRDVASNKTSINQTADSINLRVDGLNNKYSELKQTVDGIDIAGMVTFRDLAGTGTTINGSNITTGTVSGNRISGGVIEGSTLKTATPTSNGGVWIKENAIQLGASNFLYEGNTFKIETGGNTSYSSTGSIFLMPGMSGASPTGNGYVNVSGNLSCNRIEGSAINSSGNIYASGTLGCSSTLTAGNRITSSGEIHAYDGVSKLGYYAYFTPGYCYSLKINNSYLAATGSGFHVFSGGTSTYGYLYTKNVLTGYSLDEALPISENLGSVFNIIDNLEVVENKGLKIKVKEEKTINNNERSPVSITKEGLTQIDNNGMLSTLLKAVQELKQENEEIKKELKILKEKVGA